jgi:hypothetical protein
MSYADEARLLLEARELLAKQRNLKVVVNFYTNRGMAPDDARDLVYGIYNENLRENRKFAFNWLAGGGVGVVISIMLLFVGGLNLLTIVALPLCAIALLIGVGRFLVASGYEMVDDD